MEVSNRLHIYSTPEKEFPVTNNLKSGWITQNKAEGKVGPVHALKTYRGREVGLHSLLMLAFDEDGHLHTPATFHPMKPPPSKH